MTAPFTAAQYNQALREAVSLKGRDYVYPKDAQGSCLYIENRYTEDQAPSCIHGHALTSLGVDIPSILEETSIVQVLCKLGVTDKGLITAAALAQEFQDSGKTWGEAYDVFSSILSAQDSINLLMYTEN
jgi:hypothetical protein